MSFHFFHVFVHFNICNKNVVFKEIRKLKWKTVVIFASEYLWKILLTQPRPSLRQKVAYVAMDNFFPPPPLGTWMNSWDLVLLKLNFWFVANIGRMLHMFFFSFKLKECREKLLLFNVTYICRQGNGMVYQQICLFFSPCLFRDSFPSSKPWTLYNVQYCTV